MSDDVVLQYLRSIEGKIDAISDTIKGHASDITSLKETRAEAKGAMKLAMSLSAVIGAGVSYIVAWFKHY